MRRAGARAVLAVLGLLAAGCQRTRTQLVMVLDSDLSLADLPNVRMRCGYDWDGSDSTAVLACEQTWHRGTSGAEITLPASFGVLPDESRPDAPVTFAIDDGQSSALRRVARVRFVRGELRRVSIVLRAACRADVTASAAQPCPLGRNLCTLSESCEARGQTCGNEGTCRSIDIAESELLPGDAGTSPPIDVAPADAAADGAARDVSTDTPGGDAASDAGVDAPRG